LLSVERFRASTELEVEADDRERLLEIFGLYGLREATTLLDAGRSSREMMERLREISGIGALEDLLKTVLMQRSEQLKVNWGLHELRRRIETTMSDGPERPALLVELERLQLSAEGLTLDDVRARMALSARPEKITDARLSDQYSDAPGLGRIGLHLDDGLYGLANQLLERVAACVVLENESVMASDRRAVSTLKATYLRILTNVRLHASSGDAVDEEGLYWADR
jgi:hypothetical protein